MPVQPWQAFILKGLLQFMLTFQEMGHDWEVFDLWKSYLHKDIVLQPIEFY